MDERSKYSGGIASYRDLKVWQVSMELVQEVYRLTQALPSDERFGLVSQMRRAAVSVPSNIAEGHARSSTREYLHHVSFASGSIAELETQIELCKRLAYINSDDAIRVEGYAEDVGRMLRGLRARLATGPQRVREDPECDGFWNPNP